MTAQRPIASVRCQTDNDNSISQKNWMRLPPATKAYATRLICLNRFGRAAGPAGKLSTD